MESEIKSFESTVFWKVADRTQIIKSESDEPSWSPIPSIIDSFIDGKVWSSKDSCKNSIRGYTTRYKHNGPFKPYKCKMFVLPEDDLADKSDTYEEYCIKCDLIGKNDRMSETDFTIYKY